MVVGIEQGDLRAEVERVDDRGSVFTVRDGGGEALARVELRVPGEHNVLNALTALAVLRHAGVTPEDAAPHLLTFSGAARRFQYIGEHDGVLVVDDYAHHPTEIAATLTAAMQGGHGRVIAVFQPHLFSRTRYLQREFGRALTLADEAIVTEIFPAREEPEPGVSGKLIVDAYLAERPGGPVSFLPRLSDVVRPSRAARAARRPGAHARRRRRRSTPASSCSPRSRGKGKRRPAPNSQGYSATPDRGPAP